MKLDLYIDVYPGSEPKYLSATASPGTKSQGAKRYKIIVSIPNEAFTGPIEGTAPTEYAGEVDKD